MAQKLKEGRLDNRGGHKPTTSTKIMFTYRILPKHRQVIVDFIKSLK